MDKLQFIPLTDYEGTELAGRREDGGFNAIVENEGGGRFAVLIDENGKIASEACPVDYVKELRASYYLNLIESDHQFTTEIFAWPGELLYSAKNIRFVCGDHSILLWDEDMEEHKVNVRLFHIPEDRITNIDITMADYKDPEFHDGYYLLTFEQDYTNVLLGEDGEVIHFSE